MPEDRDALIKHYQETRKELLSAIDGLTDEQLSERSLDGWSVKDHLAHVAVWDEVRAQEVERISAGHTTAWRMSDQQDDRYNEITYDLRENLTPAQVKWELERSRQRLLDAIASASERGLDGSLYGEAGLRSGHEEQHTSWIQRWRSERVG